MTSPRSKVVSESNVKPSQFGKISRTCDNEDFEEIYESPLEKSKPLPPQLIESPPLMNLTEDKTRVESGFTSGTNNKDELASILSNKSEAGCRERRSMQGIANNGYENNEKTQVEFVDETRNNNNNNQAANIREDPTSMANKGDGNGDHLDVSFHTIASVVRNIKSLDANRYATKKTIAQGMLDIALLTANASQLKYILQIGKQHEFYILMLSLICVSIGLQILSGLLSLSLNLMNDCKMDDNAYARSVDWVGRVRVTLSFVVFLDNLFIATFDPTAIRTLLTSDTAGTAVVGILYVIVGGLNINKSKDHKAAVIINDLILICVFLISLINVVISGFGMEHSNNGALEYSNRQHLMQNTDVIHGIICILLGSSLNINKQQDQRKANIWNNLCLVLMLLTVAVNAVISAFDMRDNPTGIVNSTNGASTISRASGVR